MERNGQKQTETNKNKLKQTKTDEKKQIMTETNQTETDNIGRNGLKWTEKKGTKNKE